MLSVATIFFLSVSLCIKLQIKKNNQSRVTDKFNYNLFVNLSLTEMSNRDIYNLWVTIQDIIGPARLWPHSIRRLFWTPCLRHFQRILISAFVYVNGLNPDIFLQWARLIGLGSDESAYRHFRNIFILFESRRYNLYAYNVSNNRYEYIDGTVRHYVHRSRR